MVLRLTLLLIGFSMIGYPLWAKAATPSDYQLLGLQLTTATKDEVTKSLSDWDGLLQADSTVMRKRFNRFYPKNILREAYRLDIRYDKENKFASLEILYRPFEPSYSNQAVGTDIPAILKQLTPMIGEPKYRYRRTSPGIPSYNAYYWEDEQTSILLDRQFEQPNGAPVLRVRMKETTTLAKNYLP